MQEPNGSPVAYGAFLSAIDGLRADVREDNERLERRVMSALTDYARNHGVDHDELRRASDAAHTRFDEFIRNQELAQARRDGALGALRFVLEQFSRYSRPLFLVLVALAGVIGTVTGAFQVEVIVR